jgi:PAS domain S-box-containing protein
MFPFKKISAWINATYLGLRTAVLSKTPSPYKQQLEAQRIRYQNILDCTNAGTWDWNIVSGEVAINQRWAEITGYTLEELPNMHVQTWREHLHTEDAQRVEDALEEHFNGGADYYEIEFRQRHKNGGWRWIRARGKVTKRSDDDRPLIMSGIHLDITDRKEDELLLIESEQMQHSILNNVPARVFWKDVNGIFMGGNKAFTDDCDLSNTADLVGMTDHDLWTEERANQFRQDELTIMETGEPYLNYEESQILQSGKIQWLRISKVPLRNHAGKIIGILGAYEDVTESRRSEAELILAKEEAEAANSAKDDFLAVMSHEMRTPLNPIIGYADILQQSCNTEPEATYIETIINAANRQLHLIDDILDYMRIYRGKVMPSPEPFNIVDLCELVIYDAQVSAHGLKLKFANGIHGKAVPEDLTIDSDLMMLRRTLDNLVSNACKYTQEGTVTLSISADEATPGMFLIKVEDTGIGIRPETIKNLFDPFSQADSSYTRSHEGAGLGLAICNELIEVLGGAIDAQSVLGEGSCFTLRMPFKVIDDEDGSATAQSEDHTLPIFSQAFNTLIVEDRIENAQIAKTMIKALGGGCAIAENGKIAIDYCKKQKFDIILMDLSMPIMNGMEATHELRTTPNLNQNTPIIAVTADVSQQVKHNCAKAGMNGYVSKPISSLKLYEAIETGISMQSAAN